MSGIRPEPEGPLVITALHEPLEIYGSLVTLEGQLRAGNMVNFPSANAVHTALLGPNRATAVVPREASDGALTVGAGGRPALP